MMPTAKYQLLGSIRWAVAPSLSARAHPEDCLFRSGGAHVVPRGSSGAWVNVKLQQASVATSEVKMLQHQVHTPSSEGCNNSSRLETVD